MSSHGLPLLVSAATFLLSRFFLFSRLHGCPLSSVKLLRSCTAVIVELYCAVQRSHYGPAFFLSIFFMTRKLKNKVWVSWVQMLFSIGHNQHTPLCCGCGQLALHFGWSSKRMLSVTKAGTPRSQQCFSPPARAKEQEASAFPQNCEETRLMVSIGGGGGGSGVKWGSLFSDRLARSGLDFFVTCEVSGETCNKCKCPQT